MRLRQQALSSATFLEYARNIDNSASAWHNDKGKPLFPTLFGDGHESNFLVPSQRKYTNQRLAIQSVLVTRRKSNSPCITYIAANKP